MELSTYSAEYVPVFGYPDIETSQSMILQFNGEMSRRQETHFHSNANYCCCRAYDAWHYEITVLQRQPVSFDSIILLFRWFNNLNRLWESQMARLSLMCGFVYVRADIQRRDIENAYCCVSFQHVGQLLNSR